MSIYFITYCLGGSAIPPTPPAPPPTHTCHPAALPECIPLRPQPTSRTPRTPATPKHLVYDLVVRQPIPRTPQAIRPTLGAHRQARPQVATPVGSAAQAQKSPTLSDDQIRQSLLSAVEDKMRRRLKEVVAQS